MTKILRTNFAASLVALLFLFLPLSAWFVATYQNIWVSLTRDLIGITIFLVALPELLTFWKPSKLRIYYTLIIILIGYGLLTYFWKEAGMSQWLKGFRFYFMPIIFGLTISQFKFNLSQRSKLIYLAVWFGLFIAILGIMELFGWTYFTSDFYGIGALGATHAVGSLTLTRIQSIVAGPNALGLYMLALIPLVLGMRKQFSYSWMALYVVFVAVAILTFSRAAFVGIVLVSMIALFQIIKEKSHSILLASGGLLTVIILSTVFFVLATKPEQRAQLVTHGSSSTERIQQYQRIWDSKYDIGLFGRGMGTAGPASQYRLDKGSNHYTENVYLDTFEELGLIGVLLYGFLMAYVIQLLLQIPDSDLAVTALYLIVGFGVAGLFLNYYTGQLGVYLQWMLIGLALQKAGKESHVTHRS